MPQIGPDIELLHGVGKALESVLSSVPFLKTVQVEYGVDLWGGIINADVAVTARSGDETFKIVVEVKNSSEPRHVRQVLLKIDVSRLKERSNVYPVFASKYLLPTAKELCREADIGYIDLAGNCFLSFDQIFIERTGQIPPKVERKRLRSLFSPKSSRIIRRLLSDPFRLWSVQHLAKDAEVSPALVSQVKDKLLSEEFGRREKDTFFSIHRPMELLQEWHRAYTYRSHEQIECYAMVDDYIALEEQLLKYCHDIEAPAALTLFSGARYVAPFTRGIARGFAYVDVEFDLQQVAKTLGWKVVEAGGNMRLFKPQDPDLLYDMQLVNGIPIVSDVQLYLDLAGYAGRGQEQAEFILNQRLAPKWQ